MIDDIESILDKEGLNRFLKMVWNKEPWQETAVVLTSKCLKLIDFVDKVVYLEEGLVRFCGSSEVFKSSSMYSDAFDELSGKKKRKKSRWNTGDETPAKMSPIIEVSQKEEKTI